MGMEDASYEEVPSKTLIVPFTSDKGLCGGVNSFICRGVKDAVKKLSKQGKECGIVIVGDKGRSQLRRLYGDMMKRTMTEVISPGTFGLACAISSEIVASGVNDYDAVMIMYNSYVNPAVYKQKYKIITPFKGQGLDEPLIQYEFEPDTKSEILNDLYEYVLSSQIYYCFLDAAAAEQSSRVSAM